jgi:hypothetical protein
MCKADGGLLVLSPRQVVAKGPWTRRFDTPFNGDQAQDGAARRAESSSRTWRRADFMSGGGSGESDYATMLSKEVIHSNCRSTSAELETGPVTQIGRFLSLNHSGSEPRKATGFQDRVAR